VALDGLLRISRGGQFEDVLGMLKGDNQDNHKSYIQDVTKQVRFMFQVHCGSLQRSPRPHSCCKRRVIE